MKRIICIVLSFVFIISMFSLGASASFIDVKDSDYYSEAISALVEKEILTGYSDGSFAPGKTVTRAEMSAIICRLMQKTTAAKEATAAENFTSPYSDVSASHWASGFVKLSTDMNIIGGDGKGKFRPNDTVKYEEAVKMVVCALGLTDEIISDSKDWAKPYIDAAKKEGLLENIRASRGKAMTRGDIAVMIYNGISLTAEEKEILSARREAAIEHMKKNVFTLWTPEEDILYTYKSLSDPKLAAEKDQMLLKKGRVYCGIPYGYGGGTIDRFLIYGEMKNKDGIPVIKDIPWQTLGGSAYLSRLSNDCCGVVVNAWSSVGAYFPAFSASIGYSTEDFGFLRVGDYTSPSDKLVETKDDAARNGEEAIYKAYAKLLPADAVVKVSKSGNHMRMITALDVVYKEDGSIDGEKSTMTMIEQTSTAVRDGVTYYDEKLGCDVYRIGNECTYSFRHMWGMGYLPITCKVLCDPAPVAPPEITDSEKRSDGLESHSMFYGEITCNWFMDSFTMSILDSEGKTLQQATAFVRRSNGKMAFQRKFKVEQFFMGDPENVVGKIDFRALPLGSKYRLLLVCKLMNGEEITVRDVKFTK